MASQQHTSTTSTTNLGAPSHGPTLREQVLARLSAEDIAVLFNGPEESPLASAPTQGTQGPGPLALQPPPLHAPSTPQQAAACSPTLPACSPATDLVTM